MTAHAHDQRELENLHGRSSAGEGDDAPGMHRLCSIRPRRRMHIALLSMCKCENSGLLGQVKAEVSVEQNCGLYIPAVSQYLAAHLARASFHGRKFRCAWANIRCNHSVGTVISTEQKNTHTTIRIREGISSEVKVIRKGQ